MDETPNLGLPYIVAAQSQKHVTHNEAIRALDAIVQLSVLDRDLTAPPGSPANGARYIVAASPTGGWAGHAGDIAAYQDGAWAFYHPLEGFIAWVTDEDTAVVWNGSAWTALTTGSGSAGSFSTVGINATADTTNRLALAATATLLNHAGAGHQLKINKASAADTASLLYQDGFSGRAEMGLAGDDDFHFKVSADGSTWKEAIVINRTTGAASFPLTPRREVLTANRTYYVRSDGNDSNTGLANTSGGALLTIQKAIDTVAALDISTYSVTIQVGAGTYTAPAGVSGPWVGSGSVTLVGDTTTPSNVVVSVSGTLACISVSGGGRLNVGGFKLTNANYYGLGVFSNGRIDVAGNMDFGYCGIAHTYADTNGFISNIGANYTISGNAGVGHGYVVYHGLIWSVLNTITLKGSPILGSGFSVASSGGLTRFAANTFSYPSVTVSIASPGVVTYTGHGKSANEPVSFYDNGDTLPTGLAKNTTYYVKTVVDANSFTLSATAGGAAINTSGSQSGTHKLGAVGPRYYADTAGGVNTEGSGTSYLPGNAAGSATSPGWFN